MSGSQRRRCRIDSFDPFEVVLELPFARKPVLVRSAPDADSATLAFHEEWQRLRENQAEGDLLLVCQDEEARTVLRERLS
jgi:hypothetical protein